MSTQESAEQMANRKSDHLDLAFQSQVGSHQVDKRFYYEPLLSAHPQTLSELQFGGKKVAAPIWVSSMTGGTDHAHQINHNLAKACKHFGLGMGLGSCRPLLENRERLADFSLRKIMGDDLPFYANLGIAQVEHLLTSGKQQAIIDLVKLLDADGLIVHINPLQEWLQPEGDLFRQPPIDHIKRLLDISDLKIIVKEVGQGFGPASLMELMQLPLVAIDFAAHGGTNFSMLEMLRDSPERQAAYGAMAHIGHDLEEMIDFYNAKYTSLLSPTSQQVIVSGGIQNFLDGYYFTEKIKAPALYGQASALLRHARISYDSLHEYVLSQIEGLKIAYGYLRIKP